MRSFTRAFALFTFAFLLLQARAAQNDSDFKPIFNGKDLSGWSGDSKFWNVEDGAITGKTSAENPAPHNTFLIWRDGKLDDFVLRLKFKLIGGNSGIQYRSKESPDYVVGGYQADFEAGKDYSGILYEELGRGILAERGQKVVVGSDGAKTLSGSVGDRDDIQAAIQLNDWNEYEITARGNHLVQRINGRTTVDVVDGDIAHASDSGVLALQIHQGEPMKVQFKDVELKRLKLQNRKKIVLVAGRPSHPQGMHEFNAGVQLLDKCLKNEKSVLSTFYLNGWPKDPTAFDNADAILFYMDGGAGHPAIQENHIEILDGLAKQGVGLGFAHYGVEVPAGKAGEAFQRWIGGYYEDHYSVNPMWPPHFTSFPQHPIANGVKPFSNRDEWYFNIRFAPGEKGITHILTDKPDDQVRGGPYVYPQGPYPHIVAASGRVETMMWAKQREDGGRGFGFTGGHTHANWKDENQRKVVLNALLWIAKAQVPPDGVQSTVSDDDLKQNLDPKKRS